MDAVQFRSLLCREIERAEDVAEVLEQARGMYSQHLRLKAERNGRGGCAVTPATSTIYNKRGRTPEWRGKSWKDIAEIYLRKLYYIEDVSGQGSDKGANAFAGSFSSCDRRKHIQPKQEESDDLRLASGLATEQIQQPGDDDPRITNYIRLRWGVGGCRGTAPQLGKAHNRALGYDASRLQDGCRRRWLGVKKRANVQAATSSASSRTVSAAVSAKKRRTGDAMGIGCSSDSDSDRE
ncbi:unnamed protein product, partial [Amoebophrya sp. A25]|eukprot:GSA25T00008545001.1